MIIFVPIFQFLMNGTSEQLGTEQNFKRKKVQMNIKNFQLFLTVLEFLCNYKNLQAHLLNSRKIRLIRGQTLLVCPRASIAYYKVAYEQKHYAVISFANEDFRKISSILNFN